MSGLETNFRDFEQYETDFDKIRLFLKVIPKCSSFTAGELFFCCRSKTISGEVSYKLSTINQSMLHARTLL